MLLVEVQLGSVVNLISFQEFGEKDWGLRYPVLDPHPIIIYKFLFGWSAC